MFIKVIKSLITASTLILACIIINSCKDETEELIKPCIKFEINSSFVHSDTTLDPDQSVRIKVSASSDGSAITLFNFKIYDGSNVVSVDSGINCNSFSTIIKLTKGLSQQERWVFRVRNKDLQWDSISINVNLNEFWKFGQIISISNIQLGAQNSTNYGSFYSILKNAIFNTTQAANSQNDIDLCYYYDAAEDLNSLASPGANIDASIFNFSTWTTKNEARFVQTSLSIRDFDNCKNDSLIIANSFVYQSGKRKCKLLAPGNIYSFIRSNIKGLIKFTEVNGTNTGNMKMDLKIQKQ